MQCYAHYNRLDILKLVSTYTNEIKLSQYYSVSAALCGNLEMIKYLSENGAPFSEQAIDNAAAYHQLDVVKWLNQNRSERGKRSLEYALSTCYNIGRKIDLNQRYRMVMYLCENRIG